MTTWYVLSYTRQYYYYYSILLYTTLYYSILPDTTQYYSILPQYYLILLDTTQYYSTVLLDTTTILLYTTRYRSAQSNYNNLAAYWISQHKKEVFYLKSVFSLQKKINLPAFLIDYVFPIRSAELIDLIKNGSYCCTILWMEILKAYLIWKIDEYIESIHTDWEFDSRST